MKTEPSAWHRDQPATAPLPMTMPVPPVVELRGVGCGYPGQPEPSAGRRPLDFLRARPRHTAQHSRDTRPGPVLYPVDLVVSPGELVTLTGPPRSGRSTLLSVIGLLLRPTTGSYLLNGHDTAQLGDRDRAALRGRQIGLVSEPAAVLLARPALHNVMLPLLYTGTPARQRPRAALAALDRVGLADRAQVAAGDLSSGERQLMAIARAIVAGPALLLCDNPAANLDPGVAAHVIGLLADLRSDGTTILIATRDQLAAAYGSRCVPIRGGRGTPRNAVQ